MASSYSPLLRLELIGSGEQAGLWGETTNKNLGTLLEQAIAGVTTISLSGGAGTFTLSTLNGTQDQARSMVLRFIGSPSGEKIIEIPSVEKLYVARNDLSTSQKIIFKTAGQISDPSLGGVELLAGEATLVFCDGANARAGIQTVGVGTLTVPGGGTGVTSFTGGFVKSPGGTGNLTSVSSIDLTSDVTGALPVANGGTGQASFTSGRMLIGNGSGALAVLGGTSVGQVATWDGASWIASAPTFNGLTSFNGRTASAVIPQSGDYSGFYPLRDGTGASGTWGINISGSASSASTAGTANTANSASSVPWSGITSKPTTLSGFGITDAVTIGTTQSISGSKAFTGSITSLAYNFRVSDSIYYDAGNVDIAIGGSTKARATLSGAFFAFSYQTFSDPRIKENIQDYTQGLADINRIKTRTWTYNGKAGMELGKKGVGVIATEIEVICPDAVTETPMKLNPDDAENTPLKTVDSEQILWMAVNAIKELSSQVEELKAEIAALKGV